MFHSLEEFVNSSDLFIDALRPSSHNWGPHLVVIDNFYDEPLKIRQDALSQKYFQYAPPRPHQVDEETYASVLARQIEGNWLCTAVKTYCGTEVRFPEFGYRFNPESLRERMEEIVGRKIRPSDWDPGRDWWNGAFHLRDSDHTSGTIHHHYYDTCIGEVGWSGVVYLSPNAPPESGTSFWRNRRTGLCVAPKGTHFEFKHAEFERVFLAENRFNRLVLFRENLLHFAEPGFGTGSDSRLTQTFFFPAGI